MGVLWPSTPLLASSSSPLLAPPLLLWPSLLLWSVSTLLASSAAPLLASSLLLVSSQFGINDRVLVPTSVAGQLEPLRLGIVGRLSEI
jgi:small-conductance mechanosensitive channel